MNRARNAAYLGMVAMVSVLCGCGGRPSVSGVDLRGEIEGFTASGVVVSRVANYTYGQLIPIDTVTVQANHFAWRCDSLPKDIYALTPITEEDLVDNSVYALLGDGSVSMKIGKTSHGVLNTQSPGNALQHRFEIFMEGYRKAGLRDAIDSIEAAFYSARERGDTVTMSTIKANSAALYAKATEDANRYLQAQLADSTRDFFTFFLYYAYDLTQATLLRQSQLDSINARLAEWTSDGVADSRLMRSAREICALASQSVEGAQAKEIMGVDLQGDTVRLSSLRGQYLLVDFWASYCGWCRLEVPTLKEAYETYGKLKGVKFVSVSIDKDSNAWRKAVEQEGMPWENIMITQEQAASISYDYNITGIPLILLLDKDGKIMRRGIRGREVIEALAAL